MKLHKFFDQNSPEHVILHAQYRAKRGKCPSMSFKGVNNPREALKAARAEMDNAGIWMLSSRTQALTANVITRITEALGLRLPTLEELKKLLEKPQPRSSARVPFVEWDRPSRSVKLNWFGEPEETWGARTGRLFMAIPS
jgi:hypothetical protein